MVRYISFLYFKLELHIYNFTLLREIFNANINQMNLMSEIDYSLFINTHLNRIIIRRSGNAMNAILPKCSIRNGSITTSTIMNKTVFLKILMVSYVIVYLT